MGSPNSRGQGLVELLVALLVFSTLLLSAYEFSELSGQMFRLHQLSWEKK